MAMLALIQNQLSESLKSKVKLNFGLSLDFSVQLKVSLSESLSERLSQKLKWLIAYINDNYCVLQTKFINSYKQYKPTVVEGLQYLLVEQYSTAKPISDSIIILFWFLQQQTSRYWYTSVLL